MTGRGALTLGEWFLAGGLTLGATAAGYLLAMGLLLPSKARTGPDRAAAPFLDQITRDYSKFIDSRRRLLLLERIRSAEASRLVGLLEARDTHADNLRAHLLVARFRLDRRPALVGLIEEYLVWDREQTTRGSDDLLHEGAYDVRFERLMLTLYAELGVGDLSP